jgi:sulfate adenylyltransferase
VVVPAGPGAGDEVPPAVLLEVATALSEQWPSRVELRVAPLAWRDERSDEQLVHRLAERMGVRQVDYLRPDGADHGATTWRSLVGALDAGREDSLTGLDPHARESLLRWRPPRTRRGLVMVFSGLSGSGKSTLARAVADGVRAGGRTVSLLDGDVVRTLLSSGLGFDRAGRELNLQRIGWVAAEIARHGGVAICAPIAPYEQSRAAMRAMALEHGGFVLVHVSTPLEECERRDLKGLYAKARAGLITEFTGVSDPYETPTDADLTIDTTDIDPPSAADAVLAYLRDEGWLPRSPA